MENFSDLLHKIAYNIDSSHVDYKNMNINIFIPENKKELLRVVDDAIMDNKKIILRGSGTNLVGNVLPPNNSYVIDLSKLNKIISFENDSVKLEPGVILDNLNMFLEKYSSIFPVIPGSHAAAQIGSMIATNAAGMRAIKYGKMENWINSINVLIINKDKKIEELILEGEDIKDFLNSEGILGIITEINLRIIKKENNTSLDFIKFDNLNDLILKTIELISRKGELNISAVEFIDKKVSEFLKLETSYYLLVEYENNTGEIKDKNEIKKIWDLRDSCYPVVVSNGYELIEDPQMELSKIKELIIWLENNDIPTFGHIGTGILHPHYNKNQKELIKEMYKLVRKLDGKISGEHGIGIKKKEFLSGAEKNRFEALKLKYNPNNIFGGENII